ncbi:hypothetical protein BJ165DRAFT_1526410 [Panaeolus papilionaceus]|nr:hypothetical protein BJ165DRAFT_1526410 [Panaeolus papilionaceus]
MEDGQEEEVDELAPSSDVTSSGFDAGWTFKKGSRRLRNSGPKRDVLVMGDHMFQSYLRSIRDLMVSPILMVRNYQGDLNKPITAKRLEFDPESELPSRDVFKQGAKTNTTSGTLSRYMSHVCKYSVLSATMDSHKLPIINFEDKREPGHGSYFCEGGDSGSAVVTLKGGFVGLLNSGTSTGFSACNIGYATPFEWVWEQVLKEFPNANMDFDNLYNPPFKSSLWLSLTCAGTRERQVEEIRARS